MTASELKQRALANPEYIGFRGNEAYHGNVMAIHSGRKTTFMIYNYRASAKKVDEFLSLFPTGVLADGNFNIARFLDSHIYN